MYVLITHYFDDEAQFLIRRDSKNELLYLPMSGDIAVNSENDPYLNPEQKTECEIYLESIRDELLKQKHEIDDRVKYIKYINLGFENPKLYLHKNGNGILHIKFSIEINEYLDFIDDISYYWSTLDDFDDEDVSVIDHIDDSLDAHKDITVNNPIKILPLNLNFGKPVVLELKGTITFRDPVTINITEKGVYVSVNGQKFVITNDVNVSHSKQDGKIVTTIYVKDDED